MSPLRAKALFVALIVVGLAVIYIKTPPGDRWFSVGAWFVFSCGVAIYVLRLPVLRCPDCNRATPYFDNYSEEMDGLTGGTRRRVKCTQCHAIIDRLTCRVVERLPESVGQRLDRFGSLIGMWLLLVAAGVFLIVVSTILGFIVALIVRDGHANEDRLGVVFFGCGSAFILGFVLIAIGWYQKRRALRNESLHSVDLRKPVKLPADWFKR